MRTLVDRRFQFWLRCLIVFGSGWLVALACLPGTADDAPRRATVSPRADSSGAAKTRQQFSAERLVRSLKASRDEVRARALSDAERFHLEHPGLSEALWQAIQFDLNGKRISESTFAAVRLHGRLDGPRVIEQQTSLLSASDSRIVVLAAEGLGMRRAAGALSLLVGLAERTEYRTSYGFRQALVSAIGCYADRVSVDFLLATMTNSDGQLKYEASRRLAKSTGQDFGGKTAAWRTWWTANQESFRFPETAANASSAPGTSPGATTASAPRKIDWDYDVPTFYGTPIFAKRVVFLIDRSLSMLSTVDEVTRLREAQREIEAALSSLPDDATFNILAYETQVTPWQPRLVHASPVQKADALRFVNGLEATNKTACYEALVDALGHDDNIEAVLFLSDGEPTAGRIIDPLTIVQEITRQNAFRRSTIDAFGIDASGKAEAFLRQLSEANFGTYHAIR